MELDEIDLIDPKPVKRPTDLVVGWSSKTFASFGGEKHFVAIGLRLQPGAKADLGVAVAGGGIDVVDPSGFKRFHRLVRVVLRHRAKGGGTEDDARALVTSPTKEVRGDHLVLSFLRHPLPP
jgi:hypothetical protein